MIPCRPALAAGALAFIARLALIAWVPINYSFDGYQRWAGRDSILVQDWLPATQALIWLTHRLGGGIVTTRVILALVASLACVAATQVVAKMGGRSAAWFFLPITVFGPFLAWSVVPYQEGTFLLGMFGAIALSLPKDDGTPQSDQRLLAADLLAGSVALVRYEGWPFVLFYLMWRRRAAAGVSLWGITLWLTLKMGLNVQGTAPTPTDFADWNGLGQRFSWQTTATSLQKLGGHLMASGAWVLGPLGLVGLWQALRAATPATVLLALTLAAQFCALAGWLVGLETATYRMQVIPMVCLGVFAAVWAGRQWIVRPRLGWGLAVAAVLGSIVFIHHAQWIANRSARSARWEQKLVETMQECTLNTQNPCKWWVTPRDSLGTRDRHSGCEIILGISEFRHGVDFWCEGWNNTNGPPAGTTHEATWARGGYVIHPSSS